MLQKARPSVSLNSAGLLYIDVLQIVHVVFGFLFTQSVYHELLAFLSLVQCFYAIVLHNEAQVDYFHDAERVDDEEENEPPLVGQLC